MTTSRHSLEQEEVMAYLDGELSVERAAAAAAHLEHCRDCQSLAADFRNISQRMMEWEVEASDPRILTDIDVALEASVKSIEKSDVPRSGWNTWFTGRRIALAAGFGVAVILFAAILGPTVFVRHYAVRTLPAPASVQLAIPPTPYVPEGRTRISGGGGGNAFVLRNKDKVAPSPLLDATSADETGEEGPDNSVTPQGPMIIRTAALTVVTQQKAFDSARSAMDEILKRHHGYFGELTATAPQNSARSIKATLRVPANELDATMAELKKLGRVESETQGGEEVTSEYIDLEARLANARHTEQRLAQIQAQRTGKLADVLKVEVEIARVRGEIEQMEAQRKSMRKQVDFATIDATLNEEYKAPLQSAAAPSTSTQFHNAFVEGYRNVADGVIALLLFLIAYGPTLLLWGAVLFFIGRFVWKKVRRTTAS